MSTGAVSDAERWFVVVISAMVLLVGSALPLPSRRNSDLVPYGPDKFLHVLGHAGFAAAVVAALEDDGPPLRGAVVAVVSSTVYGTGIELLQERIPGREFDRGDVVAGFVGSLVGVAWWHRFTATRRSRLETDRSFARYL